MKSWAVLLLAVLSMSPVKESLAEIRSGSYVAIRTADGDRWWSVPTDHGNLSANSDPATATAFYLVKENASPDNIIRTGDYLRIRGTSGDPWLRAHGSNVPVYGSNQLAPNDTNAVFYLVKTGGKPGAVLELHDTFVIRGVTGNAWLRSTGNGVVTTTSNQAEATNFLIVLAEVPPKLAEHNRIMQSVIQTAPGRVMLGWTNIPSCSKLELNQFYNMTMRWADQRLVAYANINQQLIDRARDDALYCVVVATGAAGVAALVASPGVAAATFETSFRTCLSQRGVAETLSRSVTIDVQSECMW